MKTVDKAMTVLDQFTFERTEMGLTEISRLSGLDKAATRRLLVALSSHGFIEQSNDTRKYRLGHGFLRLARIREMTVPLERAAQEVLDWLLHATDETVHVSVPAGKSMALIAHRVPHRGSVINILPSEVLYYHATSAGLAFMAWATPASLDRVLALKRERIVADTPIAKSDILEKIDQTRSDGYAETHNWFEAGVASLAMPFFCDTPDPTGTISVVLPDHRMTDTRRAELLPILREAIRRIEHALTGRAQN